MSEGIQRAIPNAQQLDIFAKRVLGKKVLTGYQEVFQEKYGIIPNSNPPVTGPLGIKIPLKMYIVNDGATAAAAPTDTSPVKCVKLVKRIFASGYPANTIICTSKSKVTIRFQLMLLVEYMNDHFAMVNVPNDFNAQTNYIAATTKGFVDTTVIEPSYSGTTTVTVAEKFIVQNQNNNKPYESLVIKTINGQDWFEYNVTIPFTDFEPNLRACELEDPTLQSYILLKNRTTDFDVLDSVIKPASVVYNAATQTYDVETSIYTTEVDFALAEDIIDKLGIDQDINIEGLPEFECV